MNELFEFLNSGITKANVNLYLSKFGRYGDFVIEHEKYSNLLIDCKQRKWSTTIKIINLN